jgi:hypothetical protein
VPPKVEEREQPPVYKRYRFTFKKVGDARWLSHRQVMDALERMLRAAETPVRYTEGFNPHIRLSMGPPLSVGHEGLAELFDVDCVAPVRPHHVQRANQLLPEGLELTDTKPLMQGAPSLGKVVAAARYRLILADDDVTWPTSPAAVGEELRPGIRSWQVGNDGCLTVELNARQSDGPMVTVKKLLPSLGIDEAVAARVRVVREGLLIEARERQRPQAQTATEAGATS